MRSETYLVQRGPSVTTSSTLLKILNFVKAILLAVVSENQPFSLLPEYPHISLLESKSTRLLRFDFHPTHSGFAIP